MKKKLLLSILPVFVALGSCSGANQTKEDLYFQEDNLAHEEVFGDSEIRFRRNAAALPDPVFSAEPAIGVQTAPGSVADTTSVRFVAAIDSDKTPSEAGAHWTREMFSSGAGTRVIAPNGAGDCNSTVAYSSLVCGGQRYSVEDFQGGKYDYFIVYTMLNIPDTYAWYFLNAFLTFDGVNSKEVATTINENYQFSFDQGKNGYFLAGTLEGVANATLDQTAVAGEGNNASFSGYINKGDKFLIVNKYVDESNHKNDTFRIWDSSVLTYEGNSTILEDFEAEGNKIKAKVSANFTLHLTTSNTLTDSITSAFYLVGTINSWAANKSFTMSRNANDQHHFFIEGVTVTAGDKIKVTDGGDGWYGSSGTWIDCGFTREDNGNVVISERGTYTIHFRDNDAEGKHIWLEPTSDNLKVYYVTNAQKWDGALYAYIWQSGTSNPTNENHSWHGAEMKYEYKNDYGENVYRVTINTDTNWDSIIITNSDGSKQTIDIPFSSFGAKNGLTILSTTQDGKYEVDYWTK